MAVIALLISFLQPLPPPKMKRVEGGTFVMGCTPEQGADCDPDENPPHPVKIRDFYIGKYEVTNAEFAQFLNAVGNHTEGGAPWYSPCGFIREEAGKFFPADGKENHPVFCVSWFGAKAYAEWLSEKFSETYRLPTEAEWEFAARGGIQTKGFKFSGHNQPDSVAWYYNNSNGDTHEVGALNPNELGLYDMSGNVWEWCADDMRDYTKRPTRNAKGPVSDKFRTLRGGSWIDGALNCRVSYRYRLGSDNRNFSVGFRLAKNI